MLSHTSSYSKCSRVCTSDESNCEDAILTVSVHMSLMWHSSGHEAMASEPRTMQAYTRQRVGHVAAGQQPGGGTVVLHLLMWAHPPPLPCLPPQHLEVLPLAVYCCDGSLLKTHCTTGRCGTPMSASTHYFVSVIEAAGVCHVLARAGGLSGIWCRCTTVKYVLWAG